ncbi:MAG: sigma-70 family RNA polymerase sigma factor [Myxococcota bacterium]
MESVESTLQRYRGALARVVSSYARSRADREDLAQEIRLGLVRAWPRFRGESSERAYVFRVAHKVALNYAHRRKRGRLEFSEPEEPTDPRPSPEAQLAGQQRARQLLIEVRELRDPYRQVAILALEGLEPREIAEVLGVTSNVASVRLHRAKAMLAERWKETEP